MNIDLERLILLQKLDLKIARKSDVLKRLPVEIEKARADLDEAKSLLKDFDDEVDAANKRRRELETEVETIRDQIAKAKAKLPQVKTNVEYRAILKEQEGYEKKIVDLEDEQLELMEKIEGRAGDRGGLERKVKEEEEKFGVIKAEKEAAIAQVEKDLDELQGERKEILSRITPSILKKYESVLKNRDGVGVVTVRENLCQGCNQLIPPQLYYQVRTTDNIYQCPHCSRFIYFEQKITENEVK